MLMVVHPAKTFFFFCSVEVSNDLFLFKRLKMNALTMFIADQSNLKVVWSCPACIVCDARFLSYNFLLHP